MNSPGMRAKITICALISLIASVGALRACWAAISLEDFIKGQPVTVVGEIQRVSNSPKSQYATDTAFIKVEKILKRRLPSPKLEIGNEIPLTMPAASNETRISTDIFYTKGQRGVWILYHDGSKYSAGHPMALQPLADEPRIAAIAGKQAQERTAAAKQTAIK